jgi:hypothetical protein
MAKREEEQQQQQNPSLLRSVTHIFSKSDEEKHRELEQQRKYDAALQCIYRSMGCTQRLIRSNDRQQIKDSETAAKHAADAEFRREHPERNWDKLHQVM